MNCFVVLIYKKYIPMKMRIQFPLLTLILLISSFSLNAQKKKYFDINDLKCKADRAYYYRVMVPEGSMFKVTDYYAENNQVRLEGTYRSKKMEDDSREGDFNWFFSNGQKYKEGHFKSGKATGKWSSWYKDGQLRFEGEFDKGHEQGEWTFYHRNGAVKSKGIYEVGDANGIYSTFYDNGDKKVVETYAKGKSDGEFSTYFPGNIIKSKGSYLKDSLDGTYTRYWKNGNISYKGEYSDNKRSGIWEFYHSNGQKSAEIEYSKKGKFVKGTYFDEDGKKLSKKVLEDDLYKEAEYSTGKDEMYSEINKKLGDKMDVRGAKADKYVFYGRICLTIDEEGNIVGRVWEFPADDDWFEDKWDMVKYINLAIDDFPKFKPCKAYNRNIEDDVYIYYYIEFAKLKL